MSILAIAAMLIFFMLIYHSKNSLAMSEPSLTPMPNNQDFSVICSVLNLTAMSLERFYAVVYPLQSRWPLIIITLILTTMIPKIPMVPKITMTSGHWPPTSQWSPSIVGKTRRPRRHMCAIFTALLCYFLPVSMQVMFFCILLWNLSYKMDE